MRLTLVRAYARYRTWAKQSKAVPVRLQIALGAVGGITVATLSALGLLKTVFPWLLIGLGFVAALDALGAAFERGNRVEGVVRFIIVAILLVGPGILLLYIL